MHHHSTGYCYQFPCPPLSNLSLVMQSYSGSALLHAPQREKEAAVKKAFGKVSLPSRPTLGINSLPTLGGKRAAGEAAHSPTRHLFL